MKLKQIADAYGVSVHAVKKWPAEKRSKAVELLSYGADPVVMELISEIAGLCYLLQCKHGISHNFVQVYECFYVTCGSGFLVEDGKLDAQDLGEAVLKLRGLI